MPTCGSQARSVHAPRARNERAGHRAPVEDQGIIACRSAAAEARAARAPGCGVCASSADTRLRSVARAVCVSVGFLSALERGQMSASVGNAAASGEVLRLNILSLFDPSQVESRARSARRKESARSGPRRAHGTPRVGQNGHGTAPFPHRAIGRQRRVLCTRGRGVPLHFKGLRSRSSWTAEKQTGWKGRRLLFREQHTASLDESREKEACVLWVNTPPTF